MKRRNNGGMGHDHAYFKTLLEASKLGRLGIDPYEFNHIRVSRAVQLGVQNNILLNVGGGIGDRICAEPTVRFIVDNIKARYPTAKVSLRMRQPELFRHLTFNEVFTDQTEVDINKYLIWNTYGQGTTAQNFISANATNSVDFASINALRIQLPIHYKTVQLMCTEPTEEYLKVLTTRDKGEFVVIHTGKSWSSRTMPAAWYEELISKACAYFDTVVLLGNNSVELSNTYDAIDLREKLSLNDYIWLTQNCHTLFTNDSSPVHTAAPGISNRIAFVATVRSPDNLYHWRRNESTGALTFGYKMQGFYKAKMWETYNFWPNHLELIDAEKIPDGTTIEEYIPDPKDMVEWAVSV